jgi:peptidoglycan/LPS O-acetylase OafA/YrhL
MKQLGIASYAVYVLHDPVFFLTMKTGLLPTPPHLPGPAIAALLLMPLIGLALFIDMAFDRPIRRWLAGKFASARPMSDRQAQRGRTGVVPSELR